MREKYFYTVLFLDDYYPERITDTTAGNTEQLEVPKVKKFEITKTTNTENVKWLDDNTLFVRHNLRLPLTLEMWNNENRPVFYCPVLKEGIDSITVGSVVIESSRSLTLHFTEENPPPEEGETFILAMKELPSMDAFNNRTVTNNISNSLDENILSEPVGMAIVFRRRTLDELFDLIADFDESYWHSLAEGTDLKYLTRRSLYQKCRFTTKYTGELQDIIDLIDPSAYEIRFSWNETSRAYYNYEYKYVPPHDRECRRGRRP